MRRLPVLVGVLMLAGVTGCGDDGGATGPQTRTGTGGGGGGGLRLAVSSDPEALRTDAPVTWLLTVRNGGAGKVRLTFNSGRSGDVVLIRGDEEVYRWSRGRFFTEAVRHVDLEAGGEKAFRLEEQSLSVPPGKYELVAEMASDPAPDAKRRTVTVDGPP